MIRRIDYSNFKSLRECTLEPQPVNLLIGANAAGKSNVVRGFRFLADAVRTDVESATSPLGGIEGAIHLGASPGEFEMSIDYFVPDPSAPKSKSDMSYRIRIGKHESRAAVLEEELRMKTRRNERGRAKVWLHSKLGKGRAVSDPAKPQDMESFDTEDPGVLALKAVGFLDRFPRIRALRTFVEGWQFLSVSLDAIRAPHRDVRADHLEPDASNLVNVLRTIRGSPDYTAILDDLRELLTVVEDVETSVERGRVQLLLKEHSFSDPVEALSVSDGTLRLLALLTALHLMPEHGLLCVEELEHGLHPHLFGPLLDMIRERCPDGGARQIIVTTHSPDFVDAAEPEEVVVVERRAGKTQLDRLERGAVRKWLKEFRLGELWRLRHIGGVQP